MQEIKRPIRDCKAQFDGACSRWKRRDDTPKAVIQDNLRVRCAEY